MEISPVNVVREEGEDDSTNQVRIDVDRLIMQVSKTGQTNPNGPRCRSFKESAACKRSRGDDRPVAGNQILVVSPPRGNLVEEEQSSRLLGWLERNVPQTKAHRHLRVDRVSKLDSLRRHGAGGLFQRRGIGKSAIGWLRGLSKIQRHHFSLYKSVVDVEVRGYRLAGKS